MSGHPSSLQPPCSLGHEGSIAGGCGGSAHPLPPHLLLCCWLWQRGHRAKEGPGLVDPDPSCPSLRGWRWCPQRRGVPKPLVGASTAISPQGSGCSPLEGPILPAGVAAALRAPQPYKTTLPSGPSRSRKGPPPPTGLRVIELQNPLGWKIPPRSSRPTVSLPLTCP